MEDLINDIRDIDDLIHGEFESYFIKIGTSCFAKSYPKTNILTGSFIVSTNFIKCSIFDNIETDNLFASKILFRCLIEHYLRFHLIWFKWGQLKNDSYSEHYLKFSEAKEVIDIINAEINSCKLSKDHQTAIEWDQLFNRHPKLNGLTEAQVKNESANYSIKNIIRFINQELGDKYKTSMLQSIIVEYAKLSSYIHGGIGSYYESLSFISTSDRENEYKRIAGLSAQIAGSIKLFTLMMIIQSDKENFTSHYFVIDKLLENLK